MTRVAVVGGGLSGLATAHRLSELSRERGLPLSDAARAFVSFPNR